MQETMTTTTFSQVVNTSSALNFVDSAERELDELQPSRILLCNDHAKQSATIKQNNNGLIALYDHFGDDLCGHISQMVDYWQQFVFFDKSLDKTRLVADLARIAFDNVVVMPLPDMDDEDGQDFDEDAHF